MNQKRKLLVFKLNNITNYQLHCPIKKMLHLLGKGTRENLLWAFHKIEQIIYTKRKTFLWTYRGFSPSDLLLAWGPTTSLFLGDVGSLAVNTSRTIQIMYINFIRSFKSMTGPLSNLLLGTNTLGFNLPLSDKDRELLLACYHLLLAALCHWVSYSLIKIVPYLRKLKIIFFSEGYNLAVLEFLKVVWLEAVLWLNF